MQTEYKHINFQKVNARFTTKPIYRCVSNKSIDGVLGTIKYYPYWQKHCFFPEANIVFSADCLNDISHFLGQLVK